MDRDQYLTTEITRRQHALQRPGNTEALNTALTAEINEYQRMLSNAQKRASETRKVEDGQQGEDSAKTPSESNLASLSGIPDDSMPSNQGSHNE